MAKRSAGKEDLHQRLLARWLDMRGVDWFHPPNGGARSVVVGRKLKEQGAKAGVPDVVIITPPPAGDFVGTVIELKTKTGRVSEHQKRWLETFAEHGWLTQVCRGWQAAADFLKEWGY